MRRFIANLVLVMVFLAVCSTKPAYSIEPKQVGPPVITVPAFYATDREKVTSNQNDAGAIRGEFKVGCARVFLPVDSCWIDLTGEALQPRYTSLGWKLDQSKSTFRPYIDARGYVAEPNASDFLSYVGDSEQFWECLSKYSQVSDNRIFIYIHGFASSGDNAVYSAGLLSASLEAPVVAFTWPSLGTAGLKPLRLWGKRRTRALYLADRKMIDDPQVLADLTKFVSDLRTRLGSNARISLIAHSLGNRLMARYLASDAVEEFDSVYFLAADVDKELFYDALRNLDKKSRYTTVYHNPEDRVLKISGANDLLDLKVTKKLGKAGFLVPGIEFVNYKEIAQPRSIEFLRLRHYVPFEHLGSIIRTSAPKQTEAGDKLFMLRRSTIERGRRFID